MPSIPISGAVKADKSTTISTTNGLQGGGDLSANRTLSPVYGSSANTVTQGNDPRLSDSRPPTGPAGGDFSGSNYPDPVLSAWQSNPIGLASPQPGQVPTWNGSAWVPSSPSTGGSGGGGRVYYFNYATAATAPVTGLPGTPKQLGTLALSSGSSITSGTLPTGGTFAAVTGFVTDPNDPDATSIPAGLWDFNVWASSSGTPADTVFFRLSLYKYNGATATLISTTESVYLYVPNVVKQYTVSTVVPQTSLLATDRIYVELEASSTVAGKTITLDFGDATPSHTHTTIPSVSGTGIVHVINGVIQSPASAVNLSGGSSEVTGILPVANGGTGQATPLVVNSTTATNNAAATGVSVNSTAVSVSVSDPQHTHTVNSATATNNSATTGVTNGSTAVSVSITDAGHSHSLSDSGHTHTVGSTSLSGGSAVLVAHEFWRPQNAGDRLATITLPTTTSTYTVQVGAARTLDVVFFKNWDGGTVTINGSDILGNAVSETYTKTTAFGTAQTVAGTKLFAFINTNGITNSLLGTSGADRKAEVDVGAKIGVARTPVTAFLKATVEGDGTTFTFTDLATGAFDLAVAYGGKHLEVWYSAAVSLSLGSHTHTLSSATTGVSVAANTTGVTASSPSHTHAVTDPGHTHTQAAHTHTAASAATGVTASSPSHTHGVTDPQHSHTQNSHNHSLS